MDGTSLFIEFMGDSATTRVFNYLIINSDLDFSISDLARNANIGRATLYRIWDDLIRHKIVIHTRVIGRAKLFKLNKENKKVQKLIEITDILCVEDLKRRSQKQKVKVRVKH